MPTYDRVKFNPPAPVAEVTLRCPRTGASVQGIELLLDSGADVTLVPRVAVHGLGIKESLDQQYELMGFDGNRSFASSVVLDMIFLGSAFRGRYLLVDDTSGILGRDILNHFSIALDGPALQWSESVV